MKSDQEDEWNVYVNRVLKLSEATLGRTLYTEYGFISFCQKLEVNLYNDSKWLIYGYWCIDFNMF